MTAAFKAIFSAGIPGPACRPPSRPVWSFYGPRPHRLSLGLSSMKACSTLARVGSAHRVEFLLRCSARRSHRPHRGEQECNAEVGRYPRRRWLIWIAPRRLKRRNCPRGTPRLCRLAAGGRVLARQAELAARSAAAQMFGLLIQNVPVRRTQGLLLQMALFGASNNGASFFLASARVGSWSRPRIRKLTLIRRLPCSR